MIVLTKLDNTPLLINLDMVKYMEKTPDTLITFLNGDHLMVKESLDEVQDKTMAYKRKLFADLQLERPVLRPPLDEEPPRIEC